MNLIQIKIIAIAVPSLEMNGVACLSSEEGPRTPGPLQEKLNLLKIIKKPKRKCHIKYFNAVENIGSKEKSRFLHTTREGQDKTVVKRIISFGLVV